MLKAIVPLMIGLVLVASVAEATDLRRGSIIPRVGPIIPHGKNIVPNPPPERVKGFHKPGVHQHGFHHHGFRPNVVIVNPAPVVVYAPPSQCVAPGYWAYHWVPTATTQSTWIPGGWTADGVWVESHYEQRAYASGYYQPYWVPDQPYAC